MCKIKTKYNISGLIVFSHVFHFQTNTIFFKVLPMTKFNKMLYLVEYFLLRTRIKFPLANWKVLAVHNCITGPRTCLWEQLFYYKDHNLWFKKKRCNFTYLFQDRLEHKLMFSIFPSTFRLNFHSSMQLCWKKL